MKLSNIHVFFISIFFSLTCLAQDLYFAGFSFIGDTTENDSYPVAVKLYESNSRLLNDKLNESLKNLQRTDLTIIKDKEGLIKSGNAVALAYGLQKESVTIYFVDGKYNYQIYVDGQIYAFDFSNSEHKLITNVPSGWSHVFTSPKKLSKEEINKTIENIYIPKKNPTFSSPAASVFDQWVSDLENAQISSAKKYTRLQVRNITLEDPVSSQVNGSSEYIKNKKTLINETARSFESYLSHYQKVPMIPFSLGQALGKNMIARFADTTFDIKLPSPDFVVDINVREFKKAYVDNKAYDGYIYGAFINLQLLQPDLNNIKLDSKFNYKSEIQVPKSYNLKIEDDWPIWMGAQKKLFEILAKQISVRDDKELSLITNNPNIKDHLKNMEEIIISCR
jgi:hypothetical protein